MSLYIGNLSARTRRDDLERVFRRFGRCNVRLKDGYGFIVYDHPPNADNALRALQGRNICGEPLTLTWSNKQPKPYKSFARTARSYESQRSRNSVRGRGLGTNGRPKYKMGIRQPDSNGGRLINAADLLDEDTSNRQDSIKDFTGEERHHYRENFPDEGCSVEPNLVDNGRWGDQFHDHPSNDNVIESGMEIDRYEPYRGHDRKDENEKHRIAYPGGSPASQNSQERKGREGVGEVTLNHSNDLKPQQACYNCGGMGRKMCNCSKENASRMLTRFDCRHADDIKRRGRGEGSRSWGNLPSSRDTISMRRIRNDRKASGSGKHQMLARSGSSLAAKETDRALRKDYGGRKRSRRDTGTPQRHSAKKARRSVSSTLHSDYTVSRSRSTSQSSKPVLRSCSPSRSRSVSSKARSSSSNSRSSSKLHYSRSKSSKSRSRSSSPTSLSLSVSLGRPLPSSPNKVRMNQKGSLDNAITPESKEIPVEQGQPEEGDVILENVKLDNTMVAVNNKNAVSSFKVEGEMDNQMASRSLYEVTNPSTALSERVVLTGGSLSPQNLRETKEHQNFDESMMEHMALPIKKPDSEAPVSSHSCRSTSIFSEEMYMVLKHYGLDLPDENQRHLPTEAYFGSARLWPWEIIYYRRLKKGPISTENYARRLAQNREFGIVDNYIRSSSGWGELGLDNP